jgi:protein-tyrosine phosphatase
MPAVGIATAAARDRAGPRSASAGAAPRILFVGYRNVCRSPLAAALTRQLADAQHLALDVDSAGLELDFAGRPAHPLVVATARSHGLDLSRHRSRLLRVGDFETADLVVALDRSDLRITSDLRQLSARRRRKPGSDLRLFAGFLGGGAGDPPDPFIGDRAQFESLYALLRQGAKEMLRQLRVQGRIGAG